MRAPTNASPAQPRCPITRSRKFLRYPLALLFCSLMAPAQVSVTTQHNDNRRTGRNLQETLLTTTNVNVSTFGKLFARTVDGQIYAQPLYVAGLTVGGKLRNVVFVATQNDSVYAFDADDPAASAPLWKTRVGTPVPNTDISPQCVDIQPQIGVTSTPVIDKTSNTIYVVAKTKNTANSTYHFKLHALDLLTGKEKFGGPAEIAGQVPGTGAGSVNGVLTFAPKFQNNRPGLLLLNGVVYIAFASTCDIGTWNGWIFGYGASSLQLTTVFSAAPNGSDAGIWQGGTGLLAIVDKIYVVTGNGTFDADQGGSDYGDSFVKLNTTGGLSVADYFTPSNQASLNSADTDLGSGGPISIPGTNFIVAVGKDHTLRVVDTTNMGHFNSTFNADVQEFTATAHTFMGSPVFWNSPNNGAVIYLWSGGDYLKEFKFVNGKFQVTPVSKSSFLSTGGYSNTVPLSLSANNSKAGTGIIWSAGSFSGDANHLTVSGIVRAFDATNLQTELWDSKQNAARDDLGNYAKFCPPTIANGKVYVGTFSNKLVVYGLI